MNNKPKVAILGGSGRTGKYVIAKLLQQEIPLQILLRSPERSIVKSPLIEYMYGDAIDIKTISKLLHGCHAVISTIGQRQNEPLVAARATTNIIDQMDVHQIRRYIFLAGLNIDTPQDRKSVQTEAATTWMKTNFPDIQQDRQNAYSILARSNVEWTMVRVPMIDFSKATGNIKVSLYDCPGTSINAGDIAEFMVDQLHDEQYFKQSPFIAGSEQM